MKRHLVGPVLLLAALVVSGCASTTYVSTWTAPDAQPIDPAPGAKVVAVVMQASEVSRQRHETMLAGQLTLRGYEGVPSHELVPAEDLQNEEVARANFEQAGAAGVVVFRVMGTAIETVRRPSTYYTRPYYGSYWGGYHGYGWGTIYDPGYLSAETIVMIETLVYDLEQNKLVWAGTSESDEIARTDLLIESLVDSTGDEMRKAGVLVR